jgi:glycosyltransferase involved in cell wall biosynthesis
MIAVVMMVKNESDSIKTSLDSFKDYIKPVIIFDTGSTDDTISIVRDTCKKNNQILHLLEGKFKSFPESRNEVLAFADTLSYKNLLLMDAGDEFRTSFTKKEFNTFIEKIPDNIDIGLVKQEWLEKKNEISDHIDCRFIRNHRNIMYDLEYPVHEQVCMADSLKNCSFGNAFTLYQNRQKFGGSSEKRYARDIELLSKARQNKRNLYFLAQSYMSVEDFKNGFKYNVLCYERGDKNFDNKFVLVRIAFCAIQIKLFDIAVKYLELIFKTDPEPPVDAYIYYLDLSIKQNKLIRALPYIKPLFAMEKPLVQSSIKLVNHYFYDYLRFNLISIVCLLTKQMLDIGKMSIEKILIYNKPEDLHNYELYKMMT